MKTSASAVACAKCGLPVNDRVAVELLLPASFVTPYKKARVFLRGAFALAGRKPKVIYEGGSLISPAGALLSVQCRFTAMNRVQ